MKKPALSAAPVDQPLTRIAPPDGSASENTGSFVATSAAAIAAATTKTRSITPTAAPPPPVSRNVISEAQVNASLLAPPSAPVRTTFVSGKGAKLPVAEAQPAAEPEPETAVERVAYVAPVAQPTVSSASAPPVSDMTTLRAVVLAMVGLLAVGTAVRMVV